jgi:hypothetical protein
VLLVGMVVADIAILTVWWLGSRLVPAEQSQVVKVMGHKEELRT